jgi:hypothetical protein
LERLKIITPCLDFEGEVLNPRSDLPWSEIVSEESPKYKKNPKKNDNEARDEWIYDQYVSGKKLSLIILELNELCRKNGQGWDLIESPPGIKMAVQRFAYRKGIPNPRHSQKINHRLSLPDSN